ncbi:hypothetical protein M0R45_011129 [Rubus argutus]|uniref:Uncharacterized protein n=1 Tax=Rubus argutus TaxID=59490 RepID=A0AAW1Y990_RUBAR
MEPRNEEHLDTERIEDIQGEEEDLLAIGHSNDEHQMLNFLRIFRGDEECQLESMAELLYGLQDKMTMLRGSSKKYSRKRLKALLNHFSHGLLSDSKLIIKV